MDKERREAISNIPVGYYALPADKGIKPRPDDLVWAWTCREWLRADSTEWLFAPDENSVCIARKRMFTSAPVRTQPRWSLKPETEQPQKAEPKQTQLSLFE